MKIIWMLDNINTLNGMVQVVIGLSNHFTEKGHAVKIYSLYSRESTPFFHLNPEVCVDNLGREWNSTSRADKHNILGQIMENSDADILLTCNEWANSSSVLHRKKFKGKIVLTQHLSCDNFTFRRKVLNSILHRFADAVAVLTEYDKAFYERFGIRNITVIPNAVYITPGAGERTNVICSVGRIVPEKGFDMLIEAFAKIAKDFPDWKLRIWGDGEDRKLLLSRIEKLGLSPQIELPGVTDRVAEELAQSSIYVVSSRWEGLSLAMIEAMSAGNAIVSFDLPCAKDSLTPECGLVIPSGNVDAMADALRKMMTDAAFREKCGAGAYAASRKYNIDNIGQMWFNLFDRLLEK